MFYYYFRIFNWFCSLFGMKKPFLLQNGEPCKITYWHKLWSVAIIAAFIAADYISIDVTSEISIKKNLQNISDANDVAFNILIIIIDFFHGSKVCSELYQTFDGIFSHLILSNEVLKMFSFKLYLWFSLPTAIFVSAMFVELLYPRYPQFALLIKFPSYLATLHLVVHLNLVVALLRRLNNKLTNMKLLHTKGSEAPYEAQKKTSTCRYLFDVNINFMMIDEMKSDISPSFLCKVYDDLSTCIKLLEKLHGIQILCTIWIMFSNAVIGATLISSEETKYPWLLMTRAALPFSWFSFCCFVEEQRRKEVEWTEILIMKHLIDFKCDASRKKILETFKQLVSTNRLEFTAGNLFRVNYSTVLGTVMNVITYSIILVQLFLKTH